MKKKIQVLFTALLIAIILIPQAAIADEIVWQDNTQTGRLEKDESEGNSQDSNLPQMDWTSSTYEEDYSDMNQEEETESEKTIPDAGKATAAALAAAAAATALLRRKGDKTVPKSNGIYIAQSDRSRILEAINKLSKKTYYINEEGYLQVDETAELKETGSATYDSMLEGLINADKQIVLGVDSIYATPDGEETFEGESKGIAIGDNSTNQTVIVGEGTKDFEYTLAHELSHAYRGIYELRNEDSEGVNEDEEGYAILAENQIRYETGGELRTDGDSRADVDGDGKGDGDGSYGQIEGEELTLEWLFERSKGAKAASGTIFNFAKKKTSSKKSSSSKKKTSSSKKSSSSSKKSSSSSKKSSTSSKSSSSSSKTSTASKVKNAVSKAVSTVKNAVTKAATAVKTAVSTATSKATTSTSKKNETSSSKSTASTTKTSSSSSNGGGKNKNDKGATSSMSGGKNKAGSTATSSKKETESKAKESSPKPKTENTAPAKPSAASSRKQTGSKTTGNPRKQLTEGAKDTLYKEVSENAVPKFMYNAAESMVGVLTFGQSLKDDLSEDTPYYEQIQSGTSAAAGDVFGNGLGYAVYYTMAGPVLSKAGEAAAGSRAATTLANTALGKKAGEKAVKSIVKGAASSIAGDSTLGVAISTGMAEAQGLEGEEKTEYVLKNFAIDLAIGAGIEVLGVIGKLDKGFKWADKAAEKWDELKKIVSEATKVTKALSKKIKKTYKIKFAEAAETAGKKADEAVADGIKGGTYSGDLMSVQENTRYSEHWRELGIGSNNTWKAFKDTNPDGTIDDYFEIVQNQSPWPLGEVGTPTTLKAGDRFFMAVENNAPENAIGGFGVKERIDSTEFVRNNLAVKYDWKTSCNVIREFEVNSGIELNVNAGPVGSQIDLRADLYLPGDVTITQYDLFSNLASEIKREDYVHLVDEYWVD